MADESPSIVIPTPPPIPLPATPPKNVVLRGLSAALAWVRQPEKSHAIAVAFGAISAKSVYAKAAIALAMALLGIQ